MYMYVYIAALVIFYIFPTVVKRRGQLFSLPLLTESVS